MLFLSSKCHFYPPHYETPTRSDWEAERPPAASAQIQRRLTHKIMLRLLALLVAMEKVSSELSETLHN